MRCSWGGTEGRSLTNDPTGTTQPPNAQTGVGLGFVGAIPSLVIPPMVLCELPRVLLTPPPSQTPCNTSQVPGALEQSSGALRHRRCFRIGASSVHRGPAPSALHPITPLPATPDRRRHHRHSKRGRPSPTARAYLPPKCCWPGPYFSLLKGGRGGAAARGAMFLHSRWGGQRHAPGYHSKAFQEFTTIALSELTPVISNPQQYTATHSVSIVRAK